MNLIKAKYNQKQKELSENLKDLTEKENEVKHYQDDIASLSSQLSQSMVK